MRPPAACTCFYNTLQIEVIVDIQEFVSREQARGNSFRLLAACFYPPQREIFQEGLLHDLAALLKELCPEAAAFAEEMISLLPVYSDEELLVDYARLFIGPTELLAAPYGSVYVEKERCVMGDSTVAVVAFYKAHGLMMDSAFREVPDHIAVELEFLYYLVFKEIQALEANDTAAATAATESQEIFMHTFLSPWLNTFALRMAEGAETNFYRALAGCLSAFIGKQRIRQGGLPEERKAAAVL